VNDANISSAQRDLKSADFEVLLQRLDSDRECAGEKYEDIRRKLIRFFRWNDCFPGDDLADQTFDRVAQKARSASRWGLGRDAMFRPE